MKNFDEYVHFVVGAKIAGQDIECFNKAYPVDDWFINDSPEWDWFINNFRIKLPDGWEYVIEDGEIAFREPKDNECIVTSEYSILEDICTGCLFGKRPIIKRKETK